jgi:Xaa-Pro aminopeptidase
MDNVAQALKNAQNTAAALFDATVSSGLIRAGKLESELTQDIHELARREFGLRRHWHKRVVRAGANTLLTYYDESEDRRILEDDIVFLDFGPVFNEWEADFGRTYALGTDPEKHRLVADLGEAFAQGRALYESTPELTCGELYDFVHGLAAPKGWEFGGPSAGHLIGHFPHEQPPGDLARYKIKHGNGTKLREPDAKGAMRHWILEIHFIDRARKIGGFYEELLTV